MSRIAITGSSGLVGTALRKHLEAGGHDVLAVVRGNRNDPKAHWDPASGWFREGVLEGVDGVVNLSGASLADGRWTEARKRELVSSRIDSTRLLVNHLGSLTARPKVLVSASAVGYYGNRGDDVLDDGASKGEGFLADLVEKWEAEARRAAELGIRVVTPRFGVIMSKKGGALPKMLLPFKMGVGGKIASGKQWMAWVALEDVAGFIAHALSADIEGPVNTTGTPVRNSEFTKALGSVLHRPTLVPVPGFALKAMFGSGTAEEMLLTSQRVVPGKITASGYTLRYPEITGALEAALA